MADPRYARQVILPEVGPEGQARLARSSVLVVGAGGLGSAALPYLAAAGVGRIGIVESDALELSNLHRQVLYRSQDVGRPKAKAAAAHLEALNPSIEVVGHEERLTSQNALDLVRRYDVVLDGSDNFPTRYLVNDACVLAGKPDVFGSVLRFEGHASVFWAAKGPCYRCLFPAPPPPGAVPDCAEAGVLGVLPGLVGSLQASETLKILLGVGEPLVGRLLAFDALGATFTEVGLRKDPDCAVCGPRPTLTSLIDYEAFCGVPKTMIARDETPLTVHEVKAKLDRREDFVLLDVRERDEHELARIEGSTLIPMREVPSRLAELPQDKEIVVHCHHGGRALRIAEFLRSKGYGRVRVMQGGIAAWSDEVDPDVPSY